MFTPFGAIHRDQGVEFSVFSAYADSIELCIYSAEDFDREVARIALTPDGRGRWSVIVPDVEPHTPYGYRVNGPFAPEEGHLFNPAKLLFDPFARAVARTGRYDSSQRSVFSMADGTLVCDERDSAAYAPLAAVPEPIEPYAKKKPGHALSDLTIYETHVKGMTETCLNVPEELRGTYRGLAHPYIIEYLQDLGVNAVELLPIHFHFDEPHLVERDLTNYWGYSTLGYFAPDPRFATNSSPSAAMHEFRAMVEGLHEAGIEVLIDVVYNHTCEGAPESSTLFLRGFDNSTYYRLDPNDRSRYSDYTGCGNSLDTRHPHVISFLIESLRYWVEYMGVDGFRFDLAPVLGRGRFDMDPRHGFMQVVAHDAVLSKVKFLAEPWDIETYQLGHFPCPWLEWNGQFRDVMRSFWKNEPRCAARFASRITGSSDLFSDKSTLAHSGINFVTCHDGFTLRDLVSYERKHNAANKEDNRDGTNDNRAWNCGAEGETSDPAILRLRLQQQKNFLISVFLSAGIPMLLSGDEVSKTQQGNNNAYCQDNELSWFPWSTLDSDLDLRAFIRELIAIRSENGTFRRTKFFTGIPEEELATVTNALAIDVTWWRPDGTPMLSEDWHENNSTALSVLYGVDQAVGQERALFVCFNPTSVALECMLPPQALAAIWELRLWSSEKKPTFRGKKVVVEAHTTVLLQTTS